VVVFLTIVIFTTASTPPTWDADTSFTTNSVYVRFTTFSDLIVLDRIVENRLFCIFFCSYPGVLSTGKRACFFWIFLSWLMSTLIEKIKKFRVYSSKKFMKSLIFEKK